MQVPKLAANTDIRGALGASLLQYRVNFSPPRTVDRRILSVRYGVWIWLAPGNELTLNIQGNEVYTVLSTLTGSSEHPSSTEATAVGTDTALLVVALVVVDDEFNMAARLLAALLAR